MKVLLYKWLKISEFRNVELSQNVLLPTHTKTTYSNRGVRLIYCLEVENE